MITPTCPFPYAGDVQRSQFSLITNSTQVIFLEHFCASLLGRVKVSLEYAQKHGVAGSKGGCVSSPPKSCRIALHLSTSSVPLPTALLALGVTRLLKIIANLRGIKLFYTVSICIITSGNRLRQVKD